MKKQKSNSHEGISWFVMEKRNIQAKEVYWSNSYHLSVSLSWNQIFQEFTIVQVWGYSLLLNLALYMLRRSSFSYSCCLLPPGGDAGPCPSNSVIYRRYRRCACIDGPKPPWRTHQSGCVKTDADFSNSWKRADRSQEYQDHMSRVPVSRGLSLTHKYAPVFF